MNFTVVAKDEEKNTFPFFPFESYGNKIAVQCKYCGCKDMRYDHWKHSMDGKKPLPPTIQRHMEEHGECFKKFKQEVITREENRKVLKEPREPRAKPTMQHRNTRDVVIGLYK